VTVPCPEYDACASFASKSAAQGGNPFRVLVVGEDPSVASQIERCVSKSGGHVELVRDAEAACRCLACAKWDLVTPVISDSAEHEVAWWLDALRDLQPPPALVPLTRSSSGPVASRATSLGVPSVLSLPVVEEEFLQVLTDRTARGAEAVIPFPTPRLVVLGDRQMVAESPAMQQAFRTIRQVAPSSATVLLTGESGTGKELAAQAVHLHSPRNMGPFVVVNCAAIPENLIESELFGHERGAFTGAIARHIGRWERANGGTLFLDEIGDLDLNLQSKILRAIQEREIERVGGSQPIPVDVRIVAATNKDLRRSAAEGSFRGDLYFRLAVVSIRLPRLADRGDDLLLLTGHYANQFAKAAGKAVRGITAGALTCLRRYTWPGNVRELQNVLEHSSLMMTGDVIEMQHLPVQLQQQEEVELVTPTLPQHLPTLAELEARYITQVLQHSGGQLSAAARVLGIHRNTLARKLREYHLIPAPKSGGIAV